MRSFGNMVTKTFQTIIYSAVYFTSLASALPQAKIPEEDKLIVTFQLNARPNNLTVLTGTRRNPPNDLNTNLNPFFTMPVHWHVPVTIGGRPYELDPDTGSSDTWVYSDLMIEKTNPQPRGPNLPLHPCKDFDQDKDWEVFYGSGERAQGRVKKDTFTVSGVTVRDHLVECYKTGTVPDEWIKSKPDGVFGLGLSYGNKIKPTDYNRVTRWIDRVIKDNVLMKSVFTLDLFQTTQNQGSITWGRCECDEAARIGNKKTVLTTPRSAIHWEFTGTGNRKTIMDSGMDLLYLVPGKSRELYVRDNIKYRLDREKKDAPINFIVPCDSVFSAVTLDLSGQIATIPGDRLQLVRRKPGVADPNDCYGPFQDIRKNAKGLYGKSFFNTFTVCFDQDIRSGANPSISWCPKR